MSSGLKRRICFISSRAGYIQGGGVWFMDWANGQLIQHLIHTNPDQYSVAIFSDPVKSAKYNLEMRASRVYALPFPFSYAGAIPNFLSFLKILRQIAAENDTLIIQLPFTGFMALPFIRKPSVYHVCANVLTAAANPVKYRGFKRLVSIQFASIMHRVYIKLFSRRNTQLLVNGIELGGLYKAFNPHVIISSSIQRQEIIAASEVNIRTKGPVRIFFVGRPSLEKGFDTLVNALRDLRIDFVLTIVGFTKQEFRTMLPLAYESTAIIEEKFEFKGYVSWQNGLIEIIRDQDIAIVPSRSEGTPRVILECMSQGVPVIASRVGGIPTIVNADVNGILIEPGNAQELTEKIMRLWADYNWRKNLILCALETAHDNTLEQFANHFTNAIERLTHE